MRCAKTDAAAPELNFTSVLFNFSRHQSVAADHWKSFFADSL